jgi:hypothetical protein
LWTKRPGSRGGLDIYFPTEFIVSENLIVQWFDFFPQILADQDADLAEMISVYLRLYLRYQREMYFILYLGYIKKSPGTWPGETSCKK